MLFSECDGYGTSQSLEERGPGNCRSFRAPCSSHPPALCQFSATRRRFYVGWRWETLPNLRPPDQGRQPYFF